MSFGPLSDIVSGQKIIFVRKVGPKYSATVRPDDHAHLCWVDISKVHPHDQSENCLLGSFPEIHQWFIYHEISDFLISNLKWFQGYWPLPRKIFIRLCSEFLTLQMESNNSRCIYRFSPDKFVSFNIQWTATQFSITKRSEQRWKSTNRYKVFRNDTWVKWLDPSTSLSWYQMLREFSYEILCSIGYPA